MFTKIKFPIFCQPSRMVVSGEARPPSSMSLFELIKRALVSRLRAAD